MNNCKVYKNKIFDDDMEVIDEGYKNILTHKRRSKPIDKNKKYFEAVELQDKDSLRGGLKKGSGYHYDRSY